MEEKAKQILVILRECRDPRPPAPLSSSGCGIINSRGIRLSPNPADLCALAKALELKVASGMSVTVLATGPERVADMLRMALAMGADKALRVDDTLLKSGDAMAQAHILSRIFKILSPDLVCSGYRRQDQGADPVFALAAAQSGISCVHSVLSVELAEDMVHILRKTDRGGRQMVRSPLPCTLLFEEMETALYPSINAVVQSLDAPIEDWGPPELGLSLANRETCKEYTTDGEYSFPRPDPLRVTTPDPSLPAFARILALLGGGIQARQGKIHFLGAEATADALLAIIRSETGKTEASM